MGSALSHRGQAEAVDEQTGGTLGYRSLHDETTRTRVGAGLYSSGEQSVAVAGLILDGDEHDRSLPALLEQYNTDGATALASRLHGAYVVAIRDGSTCHVIRDGAGVRTAYYGCFDGRFLFAVEPKGVLAAPGFPRRIRPGAVAQYLTFSFVPGATTMLEGLHEIPAGHVVTSVDGQEPKLERYFRFEEQPTEERSDQEWVGEFRNALLGAVAERIPHGEDVGLFLSGGIDSSVVAVEAARQIGPELKTYSIHFGDRYPHELDFAHAVANRLGTDHEDVLIQPQDFLPRLREMIWHLDDPIGDPITMPNFELSARVASEVRWVFNGEGGDPLFGGPKNMSMLLHHWYGGVERDESFRERMYLASYRRGYDELQRLLTPEWREQYDEDDELVAVLRPFFKCERPSHFLDKLLAINIRLKGAHLILPKVERMTTAWGLTALSPFFDDRLIGLSFRMPPTMKLRRGIEKWVLKRAYENDLPAEVIARPKSGMRVPVHFWFQGELKRYARKILSPRQIREAGIFNADRVEQLLSYDTEEGPGRYGLRLWMLLSFEIWRRIVVEREPV